MVWQLLVNWVTFFKVTVGQIILAPMCFSYGIRGYFQAPFYRVYTWFGAIHELLFCTILVGFHFLMTQVISSFTFLWRIYQIKKIPMKAFLYDWVTVQGKHTYELK